MDKNLKDLTDFVQQDPNMPAEQKESILKSLKAVDKELQILSFKLDRTEKVKRTTAILLEKTIEELEQKRNAVEETLAELKSTQAQLVQQEKLASLGQLTAAIAHEIKNPLNFVNNFSEVSAELVDEVTEAIVKTQHTASLDADENLTDALSMLDDLKQNLSKILQHGTRADGIVTSMLQHSRGGTGNMEPTDLNALIMEFVNLAFHGMRASKNPINVKLDFDLDPKLGQVNLIGEEFSRVVLNIANNAFDAMREKSKTDPDYKAELTVKSFRRSSGGVRAESSGVRAESRTAENKIEISIADNGPGIPEAIKDKILQPFFTTKKGTEGTGLGLSITNDIIKAHGGSLSLLANEVGAEFKITLNA